MVVESQFYIPLSDMLRELATHRHPFLLPCASWYQEPRYKGYYGIVYRHPLIHPRNLPTEVLI